MSLNRFVPRVSRRDFACAALAAAFLIGGGSSSAQPLPCGNPVVGGAPYTTAWVDAAQGNDATGTAGVSTLPYRTINGAIGGLVAALGAPGPANRGLVVIQSGVYSAATTGETFPIVMFDWIDVQGLGAKECVIRGDGTQATVGTYFVPLDSGLCTCGSRALPVETLFDFSFLTDLAYDEMLDGVTLQGGDVQAYAESIDAPVSGRISNCAFDLLQSNFGALLGAPSFGVLMVHPWQGAGYVDPTRPVPGDPCEEPCCCHEPPSGPTAGGSIPNGYADVFLHVLNNTFVQTWSPDGSVDPSVGQVIHASAFNVAICDVTDPRCDLGAAGDPTQLLRGVGNPNIQSNLIRTFDNATFRPFALMGIDAGDTTCAVGTQPGPSNAFDPAVVGGANTVWCSQIVGATPVPRTVNGNPAVGLGLPFLLNPNPLSPAGAPPGVFPFVDPGFIGEAATLLGGLPNSTGRDWRLVPDSMYQNAGTGPTGPFQLLRAANFTQHFDLGCTPSSSFDFDGEGYGNPRRETIVSVSQNAAPPAVAEVDIGFDETSILVDAGTGNDSVAHSNAAVVAAVAPFIAIPTPGFGQHLYVYPTAGSHTILAPTPVAPPLPAVTTSIWPGAVVPPFVLGIPFVPGYDIQWGSPFVPPVTLVPVRPLFPVAYVSVFDGLPHVYGADVFPSVNGGVYVAEQALFTPAAGPNAGLNHVSNLQGNFD